MVWGRQEKNKKTQYNRQKVPVILATQEAEIRRIEVQSQPRETVCKTLSQKSSSQKWLVEWLEVKALSSSPSTTHIKKKSLI
jgi:hypothetical protein